jgi:purine-binding chemotaxis protein CheW
MDKEKSSIANSGSILKRRAELIAMPLGNEMEHKERIIVVDFLLIPERYAISGNVVSEVIQLPEYCTLPGTPSFVVGVINNRGKILSIINLKNFLHLPTKGITELNKVIVIRWEQVEFGILVDAVHGTRYLETDQILSAPAGFSGIDGTFISGVTADGMILLEASTLFSQAQLIVNQK